MTEQETKVIEQEIDAIAHTIDFTNQPKNGTRVAHQEP